MGGEKLCGGQEGERICDQLPDNEPYRVGEGDPVADTPGYGQQDHPG